MPNLSGFYSGSFRSVGFWVLDEGPFTSPGADLEEDYTLLRIPGGNTTVLQSFGNLPRKVDLAIAINGADLTSLVTKHGTNGTLIYNSNTVQARLVGITQPTRDNADMTSWKMTLKFVLS